VIRVEINNVFITAIYILLEKKTQTTYEKMLTIIMEKFEDLEMYPDPNTINSDFEKAVINAIKSHSDTGLFLSFTSKYTTASAKTGIGNILQRR